MPYLYITFRVYGREKYVAGGPECANAFLFFRENGYMTTALIDDLDSDIYGVRK